MKSKKNMSEPSPAKKIKLSNKEGEDVELYYDPEYKIQISLTNCADCPITIVQRGQAPNPPPPPKT
jgi:hypothetical protein